MLTSSPSPRTSPSIYHHHYHGPASTAHQKIFPVPERRLSKSVVPSAPPGPVHPGRYIDAGTPHSPNAPAEAMSTGDSAAVDIGGKGLLIGGMEAETPTTAMDMSTAQASTRSGSSSPRPATGLPTPKRRPSDEAPRTDPASGEDRSAALKRARAEHPEAKVLPSQYEFCAVEDLVVLIANMISELIQTNDQLPLRDGGLTRFHSRYISSIVRDRNNN